jgi:hypothetical protein
LLIGCSPSHLQLVQYSVDQYLAINDSDLRSTDNILNLTIEPIPPIRQSDKNVSDKALDIIATLGNSKIEIESCSVMVQDSSDTTGQLQACISNIFLSPHLMITNTTLSSLSEAGDDFKRPEQMAEVVDTDQEWEICDIIRKEDINRVVHYLVEWNPILVPKYTLKNVKVKVNKFEV